MSKTFRRSELSERNVPEALNVDLTTTEAMMIELLTVHVDDINDSSGTIENFCRLILGENFEGIFHHQAMDQMNRRSMIRELSMEGKKKHPLTPFRKEISTRKKKRLFLHKSLILSDF